MKNDLSAIVPAAWSHLKPFTKWRLGVSHLCIAVINSYYSNTNFSVNMHQQNISSAVILELFNMQNMTQSIFAYYSTIDKYMEK